MKKESVDRVHVRVRGEDSAVHSRDDARKRVSGMDKLIQAINPCLSLNLSLSRWISFSLTHRSKQESYTTSISTFLISYRGFPPLKWQNEHVSHVICHKYLIPINSYINIYIFVCIYFSPKSGLVRLQMTKYSVTALISFFFETQEDPGHDVSTYIS